MKVRMREHGEEKASGLKGLEYGTSASGQSSGLKKGGISSGERGATRASKPIGHSDTTERFADPGHNRYKRNPGNKDGY